VYDEIYRQYCNLFQISREDEIIRRSNLDDNNSKKHGVFLSVSYNMTTTTYDCRNVKNATPTNQYLFPYQYTLNTFFTNQQTYELVIWLVFLHLFSNIILHSRVHNTNFIFFGKDQMPRHHNIEICQ